MRETKELKTPSGITAVIKTFLTVREYRCIEDIFLNNVKVSQAGQVEQSITGSAVRQAEDELIKQAVVSINGNTEGILDTLLEMRKPDFDFIIAELNKLKDTDADAKKEA